MSSSLSISPIGAAVSIERCCQELGGISRSHVYTLLNEGVLKSIKVGRRRLIVASSIVDMIINKKVEMIPEDDLPF